METLSIQDKEQIKHEQLGLLREKLEQQTYPGYPPLPDRLVTQLSALAVSNAGDLAIADGVWTVDAHSNRPDVERAPSRTEQQAFREQGLALDTKGRPLHPWLKEMIEDPGIGIVTGKGAYWNWGPNYTADGVVFRNDEVLLIERKDTGALALPGGFVDGGEEDDCSVTALREIHEESGIIIPETVQAHKFYKGLVVDIRTTANAWPETTGYCMELDGNDTQIPIGADDAERADFVPIAEALHGKLRLFGAHHFLLRTACAFQSALRAEEMT